MALKEILDQIKKEAEVEIAKLDKARDEAIAEIKKEYAQKRDHRKVEMGDRVKDNVGKVKTRAKTFAKMETRNNLLRAKRALLQEIFDDAVTSLVKSDKYTDIVTALLKSADKEFHEGTVIPAKGKKGETQKALEASGAKFEIASEEADIQGGFILESGKVEVNFSFDSILAKELWSDLEVQLNQLLFP